jgi:hypothetical protein
MLFFGRKKRVMIDFLPFHQGAESSKNGACIERGGMEEGEKKAAESVV